MTFLTEKKTCLMIFFSSTSYSTTLKLIYPANPAELTPVRRTLFLRIMQDTLILSPGFHMTRHLRGALLGLHETGPEATTTYGLKTPCERESRSDKDSWIIPAL